MKFTIKNYKDGIDKISLTQDNPVNLYTIEQPKLIDSSNNKFEINVKGQKKNGIGWFADYEKFSIWWNVNTNLKMVTT